jgi:dUTP pyrophosphatase
MAKVKVLQMHVDLPLPKYQTMLSAGMDVYSAIDVLLKKGEIELVPTGLKIALPEGFELHIRPRSGLALKYGISLPNTPATIDADFRGELKVIMINHGKEDFVIKRGDRIAQIVLNKFEQIEWEIVEELDKTTRGEGSFGSTGV